MIWMAYTRMERARGRRPEGVLLLGRDAPKNRSSKSRRSTGFMRISYALLRREVCFADSSSRPGFLSGTIDQAA